MADTRHPLYHAATALMAMAIGAGAGGCGSAPTGPSATATLPLVRETASMRYYHEAGDAIEVERQEAFNAWALGRLGVQPPQPVEYPEVLVA